MFFCQFYSSPTLLEFFLLPKSFLVMTSVSLIVPVQKLWTLLPSMHGTITDLQISDLQISQELDFEFIFYLIFFKDENDCRCEHDPILNIPG